MKIEPGKIYKCRNGQKARVYATDGQGSRPVHGALWIDEKVTRYPNLEEKLGRLLDPIVKPACWYMTVWAEGGRYYESWVKIDSPYDLVEEWNEAL